MKDGSFYRYNIKFPGKTELEIRAGEFLETLGRKKSSVIITALNEYLDHHPELSDDIARTLKITCATVAYRRKQALQQLKALLEDKIDV